MKEPAVFAVVFVNGKICATTREDGTIGLPGGKREINECHLETAVREAKEEGWEFTKILYHHSFLTQVINDRLVTWVYIEADAKMLTDHKEKHRGIIPILSTMKEIIESGRGNKLAMELSVNIKEYSDKNLKPILLKQGLL
jgi:ADP-ribose pyrophosphatase YjhB (NUDIX family)